MLAVTGTASETEFNPPSSKVRVSLPTDGAAAEGFGIEKVGALALNPPPPESLRALGVWNGAPGDQ